MNAESPDDVDKDLLKTIEEEREERLDPDNRPENAEVDNSQRTFIAEEARFEDSDLPADDGVGQKEPDPEAQTGGADDSDDSDDSGSEDSEDSSDSDTGGEPDTDAEAEATQQEAESDASTGPQPTGDGGDGGSGDSGDSGDSGEAPSERGGRHKA
jgi:hypothetical protein